MRTLGILAILGMIIGVLLVIALLVLAYLGIRAALEEEKKRRRKATEPATRDGPVPMFSAKRKEE